MSSHRTGSLKQRNKSHKGEKKRTDSVSSGSVRKSSRALSKKQRRSMAKQKRLSVSALKNLLKMQTVKANPIWCALIALTNNVPTHLAQLLFQRCDSGANSTEENPLLKFPKIWFPSLNKNICFMSARPNDLFGMMDLILLADWVIVLIPSDFVELNASSEALLTCLYAHGLGTASFAVMSSGDVLKNIKQELETRFPVPENTIYPLNTPAHALNLLRHICATHKSVSTNKLRRGKDDGTDGHSATRYRAKMLVDRLDICRSDGTVVDSVSNLEESDNHLLVEGLLRGAPMFLRDPLEQKTGDSVNPLVHLSGWGDFPIASATWYSTSGQQTWSVTNQPPITETKSFLKTTELADFSDDGTDDSEHSSFLPMTLSSDDEPVPSANLPVASPAAQSAEHAEPTSDVEEESTFSNLFAARTMVSSRGSTYSTTQLAKFRAARTEEMFPDEKETPQSVPAYVRFAKYRSLPRFQGCVWPVESDTFPAQYENIACFKNYNRNRRSIMHYLQTRVRRTEADHFPISDYIPPDLRVQFVLGPVDQAVIRMLLEKHKPTDTDDASLESHPSPAHTSPLCLWSLLPHECRISVCHFTMRRVTSALRAASDLVALATAANKVAERLSSTSMETAPLELGEEASTRTDLEQNEILDALAQHQQHKSAFKPDPTGPTLPPEAEPIRSKDLMLYQVGIRRFIAAPVYSTQTTHSLEKAKFEHFFSPTQSAVVASVYAPVMYSPANVLQFRIRVDEDDDGKLGSPYIGELVAVGALHSVDPTRLIIKRIFLSGHPYKIHKRSVVVRYMFFNPTDVDYFKSVQLQTKTGAVGHIKQSVGTHGHMKCVFDRMIQGSDVVLMPLYKRVFPKWVYQPIIWKAVGPHVPPEPSFEWQQAPVTLQLGRRETSSSTDEHNLVERMALML